MNSTLLHCLFEFRFIDVLRTENIEYSNDDDSGQYTD